MLTKSPTINFKPLQTTFQNEGSFDFPKTTEKILELVELFHSLPQVIDAVFWQKYGKLDVSLEIENPSPLCDRVRELAAETWNEDAKRIILIPGGLTLSKVKQLIRRLNIPITIEINPKLEMRIKGSEKPRIIVFRTSTDIGLLPLDEKLRLLNEEGFDVLSLVTAVALSHCSIPNNPEMLLFRGSTILCSDRVEERKHLAVQVGENTIHIKECLNPKDSNIVTGTMIKI
jgi:hypothetical protein